MEDPLDTEPTQEATTPSPAPEPLQAETSSSLDQFLYGDQPQQAQPIGGLDEFLYGSKQQQDAINQKIPIAQHIMALRDDPNAIDPISSLARKIQEPSKGEAAWADYNNSMANPDYDQLDQFKDAESKNEWGKMAKIGIQMIGKDWGDYISAMLGLTDEDRKKNQESFGAQLAIGKITDPKDAATALQLSENYEKDLQEGRSIAPENQKPAMSFGTGQLSLKLGMNLAEADEYYKKLKDEKTKSFGEAALRNFAVQSGDAFIPFVSVGDIIVDEKNPDQVARRAALAKAINQTVSEDYFLGTVAGQAAGSLGGFMAAGSLSTKFLGRAAQIANAEVKVPTMLSKGAMYGVMGTSQSVKTDTRNLSPMERLASIFSESAVLGLSEAGGDILGDQLDDALGSWIAASSLSKSVPAFTPVANGALKTLSVMVGESASDQLDNVMRGNNPFEGIGLSYATNFGVGLGLALAPGVPWALRKAKILASADNKFKMSLGQTFDSYRNDPRMTEEQRNEAFLTIRDGLASDKAKVLADRLWALTGVNEADSPQTHSVLKQGVADAEKDSVEAELDAALSNKKINETLQNEKDKVVGTMETTQKVEGELLPGVPVTSEQEKVELDRFKNFFQTGGKEYRIQNTPENAEKIKWLESKGSIYGNLTENDDYYVVKGVRTGEGDLAKWYGEDDPKERFQDEKFQLGKEISKAHKGQAEELNQKIDELDNAATYDELRRLAMKYGVPLSTYEQSIERSNIDRQDRPDEELVLNNRIKKLNDNLVAMKKLRDETPEEERFALNEGIAKVEKEIQVVGNQKRSDGQKNFDKNVRDMEQLADIENDKSAKSGELAKELKDNPEVILAILNPKNESKRQLDISQPSPVEEDKSKLGEAFNLEDDRVVANLQRLGALDEAGRPLMTPAETIIAYITDKMDYVNGKSLSGYRQYNVADQVYQGFVNKALLEIRKGNKISLSTIFNSQLFDFIKKAKARMRAGVGLGSMQELKETVRKTDPQSLIDDLGMDENQAELVKNTFDEIEATEAEWQAAQPGAVPTPTVEERIEAMSIIAGEIAPGLRETLKSDVELLAFDSLLNSKIMANLDSLSRKLNSSVTDIKLIQDNIQKKFIEAIKTEYRKRLSEDNLPSLPAPEGEVKKAGNLTDQQIEPTLKFYSRALSETLLTDTEKEQFDSRKNAIISGRRLEDLRSFQEDLLSLIDDKLGIDVDGKFDESVIDEFVTAIAGVEGDKSRPGNLVNALAVGKITKAQQAKFLEELIAAEEKATRLINEAKDEKQLRAAAREYRATLVRINDQLIPKPKEEGGEIEKPTNKIQEPKPTEGAKTVAKLTADQRKEARRLAKEKQAAPKPGEGKQPGKPGEAPAGNALGRGVSRVLQRVGAAILPKKYTQPKGYGLVPYDETVVKNLGGDIYDNLSPEQRQDVASALASMEGSKNKSFYLANGAGTGKTRVLLAVAKHYLNMGKKVLYLTSYDAVTPDWQKRTIGGTIQQDAGSKILNVPLIAYGGKESGIDNLKSLPEGVVTVSTYNSNYLPKFLPLIDKDTVVLFDEQHSGRNLFSAKQEGGSRTSWPVLIEQMSEKAGSVMMASGTPFDRPDQLLSLKRLGIFDSIAPEQLLRDLGFQKYEVSNSKKYYWDLAQGVSLDQMQDRLEKYIDRLALTGIFRSRSLKLDGINVEFKNVALDKNIKTQLDDIANRYGGDNNQSMQARMKAVTAQKRALEKYKVATAARQAVDAIKRGVKPIVYVGFVSEKDTQGNDVDQISLQVEEAITKLIAEEMPQLSSSFSIARLYSKGDPKDVAIDKFNNQGANVLIATTAMGGTGIELDDKDGDQPREMIIMSPPVSAISAVQLVYRVWRADSASRPNIVFLTAEHQVDQEPLDRMRQKMRLLDAVMGAGFEGLKGDIKEEIQTTVSNDPAQVKSVEESLARGFKGDYKDGVLTLRDPKTGENMTYKVSFNSGIDSPAHADYGVADSEDTIVLNPAKLADSQKYLGDKFNLWIQAVMVEEAIHLETVRLWRAQGKNIQEELAKVANGMSAETRRAHARLYFATYGYDLNKPEVQLKIDALASDDQLIAFEAIRQTAQFNLTGTISEQLAVVTEADISRVRAIANQTLLDETDKDMFDTIASYLGNMLTALKTKFGITTEVRLSLREAIQNSIVRLNKTQAEYTKLADQKEPEAAPFQGSPAQPISLGVFGTYDLRVNRLIESYMENELDNIFGVTADLFGTVDRKDWLFALDQAAKNGVITNIEKTLYRAASLDSLVNGRVDLSTVLIKAIEVGEAMETGMLDGTRGAVAIPAEAFVPIPTVQDTPITDSKIQRKEMYRFVLRGYPSEKTFADTLDQALSQGAVKLLSNREKVIYEGQEYTYKTRGALIKELQRRGANNYVSKVKITPSVAQPAVSLPNLLSMERNGELAYHGTRPDQITSLLGGIRVETNFSPDFNGQAFGSDIIFVYPKNQLSLEKKSYQDDLVLKETSSTQPIAAMLDIANFAGTEARRSYYDVAEDIANLSEEDSDIAMELYTALDLGDRKKAAQIRDELRGNPAAIQKQISDMRIKEFKGKYYLPTGEQILSLPRAQPKPNAETINRLAVELSNAPDKGTPAVSLEEAINNTAAVIPDNLSVFTYELSDAGKVVNVNLLRQGQQKIVMPSAAEPRMVESQAMKNLLEKYGDNFPDVTFKDKFLGELYNVSVSMDQQFEDARQYIEENGGWRQAVIHYLSNSMDTSMPIQAAVGFELLRTLGPLAKTDKNARDIMAKVMLVQKQRYGTDPGRTVQLWSALSDMADNPEAMRLFVHGELAEIAAGRLAPYKQDIDNVRTALKDAGRIAADRVATSSELESTIDKIAKLIEKNRKEQNFEGIDKGMFDFINSDASESIGDAFLGAIAVKPKAAEVPGSDADEIRLAPERIKNLGTLIAQIVNSSESPDTLHADPETLRSLVYLTKSLRNNPNQAEVRRLVELYFDAAYSYSLAIREAAKKGIQLAPAPSVTKGEATKRATQDKIKAEQNAPIQISSDIQDELSTYAPPAAEALERLSKNSQLPPIQKEFVDEFARLLRSDMTAMIKQAGGLQPKFEKPKPPTGAEILRDRIMNIEAVRSFIAEVQEILMEKYKGRESELVGVWPYIEDAWNVPFSLTSFSKTIKSLASIGGPKVNVRDIIRSSQGDIEAFENMLGELLTKNTNLDEAQIKTVNDYLRKKMAEFLKDERTKELNRIKKRLEDRKAGKKARKQATSALTRLIDAANLGVLKDEILFSDLRTQLGLPEMTAEQLNHLNKMIDDLPNYPKGRVRNQKISKMYEYVKLLAPMTVTELLTNYQSMNLLLAFGTSGINAFSSFANNLAQASIIGARGAIKTVTGTVFNKPEETIRGIGYMKAALETFKPLAFWNKNGGIAWKAAKEIFLKGDFSNVQSVTTMEMGGINMFEAFTSQLDSYLKKSTGAVKPEITIKTPGFLEWIGMQPEYTFSLANKYAFSKFNPATVGPFIMFGRLMAIGDSMNTISAKKMYQMGEAYNIALKKGFTTLEEVEKEVARILNSTPEARRRAEARATEENKEFNYTPYQYALRVDEIIEQERPQDEVSQELAKRTEKFAERTNFRNNFEGVLGAAMASAVTLSNIFPPSKFVLKYLRTGAALGNAAMDIVPLLGQARYMFGIGNFERMRDSKFFVPPAQKDTVDRDIALGKLWLSYILGAGLLALLRKALDREPDPDFNIHISGPKDPAQRKALLAAGWKARSIQIGTFENGNPRFISFESLPPFLAGVLIPIGAFTEAIRYEKRSKQEAVIPTLAAASWMTIYAMMDYAFLSGIRGLIQLAAPSSGGTTSTDQLTNIVKFIGNVASTLLPGYASLRDIEKLIEGIYGLPTGRLYQDSFMSVFLASVPFASKVGEPALDFLGGTTRAKFWNSVPFVRRLMTTGVDTSEYAQGSRTEDAIHDKLISLFAKNQVALDWEAGPLKIFAAAELANKPTIGVSELLTLKRELTETEKYDWMQRAYPRILEVLGPNIETLQTLSPVEFKYIVGELVRGNSKIPGPMPIALYETLLQKNQQEILQILSPEATNVLPTETK
jgi:hypothetical protein